MDKEIINNLFARSFRTIEETPLTHRNVENETKCSYVYRNNTFHVTTLVNKVE